MAEPAHIERLRARTKKPRLAGDAPSEVFVDQKVIESLPKKMFSVECYECRFHGFSIVSHLTLPISKNP